MSRSLYTLTNFLSQKEILCVQGPTHISFLVKFFVHARSCSHFFPRRKICVCVQGPAHISPHPWPDLCLTPSQIPVSFLARSFSHSYPCPCLKFKSLSYSYQGPCVTCVIIPWSVSYPYYDLEKSTHNLASLQ